MIIKRLETKDEIKGKAAVHYQAWKEAYVGLVNQDFLDRRTMEMSLQSAQWAFDNGIATSIAKDGERVVGFVDFGGYALMKRAFDALSEYPQTAVWVLTGNERAIRFYKRCGFEFDGEKKEIELGTPATEARMILRLKSDDRY